MAVLPACLPVVGVVVAMASGRVRFIRSPLRMVVAMMAGAGDIGVTPGRVRGGGGSSDRPCGNFSTDGSLNVS